MAVFSIASSSMTFSIFSYDSFNSGFFLFFASILGLVIGIR